MKKAAADFMKNHIGDHLENDITILKSSMLFADLSDADLLDMLHCLSADVRSYKKNCTVILEGDPVHSVGLVLSGAVQVIHEDYLGNKHILAELLPSEIFAETFVCAGIKKSPVTVMSITACRIMFIEYRKILSICTSACSFHTKLVENMLKLIAYKNIILNQKIEFISKRTTREKLLSYFAVQMRKAGSTRFTIPFSRHELSDFLCVDRSAMSRELCRLRDDGLLRFHGNDIEMIL